MRREFFPCLKQLFGDPLSALPTFLPRAVKETGTQSKEPVARNQSPETSRQNPLPEIQPDSDYQPLDVSPSQETAESATASQRLLLEFFIGGRGLPLPVQIVFALWVVGWCGFLVWNQSPWSDPPSPSEHWQDGQWSTYAQCLMKSSLGPFLPLWLYALVALILVQMKESLEDSYLLVRGGLLMGVVLSFQFIVTVMIAVGSHPVWAVFLAVLVVFVTNLLLMLAATGVVIVVHSFRNAPVIGALCCGGLLIALVVTMGFTDGWQDDFLMYATIPVFIYLVFAVPGCAAVFGRYFWGSVKQQSWRFHTVQLLSVTVPIAAYVAAWRMAILGMFAEYQRLPAAPPAGNCYVVTAATRGHPWLVGSWRIQVADGSWRTTSRQLQRLKLLEFAIATATPNMHLRIRSVYNRVGPWLANRIQSPWLADASYLLLKPLEWLTAGLLLVLRIRV